MSYLSTRPARWSALLAAGGLAAPALLLAGSGGAANAAVPPPAPGWTTVFSEDFSGAAGTGLNTGNWLYDVGTSYPGGAANWGTGEIETMTSSTANVYHDGAGHLAIKPIRDAAGNWTSGRVETQRTDLAAPVGGILRIEGRLQQPNVNTANGAGYWPAFWTLGAAARPVGATNWPSIGEWDIMESINGRPSVFGALHCGVVPGGPCNEPTGIGSGERPCAGCNSGFHTYAVEYDRSVSPERLRYYLDGNNYFTVMATQVDAATWAAANHHGMFIILNVAIGGAFPAAFGGGPNAATVSGVPMLVDYVAAYTKTGDTDSAPSVPTGFGVAGTTPTSVTLNWQAVSGATSYNILRAGIKIAATTSTTFTDARLNPRTPYIYSVQAVNAAGTSAATGEVTVTTPG
jgi:beta-glucanase (GH16 family)